MAFVAPGLAAAETGVGLDLRISAEKAEFAPGEPIPLTFHVTNANKAACGIATSSSARCPPRPAGVGWMPCGPLASPAGTS